MRVLAFTDVALPEGGGGVERTLDEVYGRLARSGFEVELIALSSHPGDPSPTPGVGVRRVPRLSLSRLTGLQVALSFAIWPEAIRCVRRFRPDVIHAHTLFFFTTVVAAVVAACFRVPLVLTVHVGSMKAMPRWQRLAIGAFERTVGFVLLRSARRIICVSDDVAAHVRSLHAPADRLVVIPNGVDLRRFSVAREPASPPVILCVGRLIVNKAPGDLVEAARLLRDEGRHFRLAFAGSGPLEPELRRMVRDYALMDRVQFLGPRTDVDRLLSKASVFVRPSLTDGMSLALLEAMASGTPVVATRVSGAEQLLRDGEHGLLVPPARPRALARAIDELLDDPARAGRIGAAARARARDFDWDTVARRTGEVLADAAR